MNIDMTSYSQSSIFLNILYWEKRSGREFLLHQLFPSAPTFHSDLSKDIRLMKVEIMEPQCRLDFPEKI